MISEITSLADLRFKAKNDICYQKLIILYSKNLFGDKSIDTFENAMDILYDYKKESEECGEYNCLWLVDEINRCIAEFSKTKTDSSINKNVKFSFSSNYGPGVVMEYGWWDGELETKIRNIMRDFGVSRNDAIVRIFREGFAGRNA